METSEVLVHVSAPSTAADDARYRAQVQAILGFQPASCQVITLRSDEGSYDQAQDRSQDQDEGQSLDRLHPNDARHRDADAHAPQPVGPPLPCTSESASDLEPHVIPHNNNAVSSTEFTLAVDDPPPRGGAAQDSLGSPVSVIPDSQPEILVSGNATGFESLDQYQRTSAPDLSSPPQSKRCRIESDPTPDEHSKVLPDKQLPPAARDGKQEPELELKGKHSPHQSDHEPRPPHSTPAPMPTSKPKLPAKGKDKDSNKASHPPAPALEVTIAPPMQIRPPPPPISNKRFTTHITPTLSMLFKRLHSPRIYTPIQQSRPLDILERGYWYLRIDILHADADANKSKTHPNTWDRFLFNRFWSFLSELVGKEGRAGWGVWCYLEDVSSSVSTDPGSGSETRSGSRTDSNSTSPHNQRIPPAHELGLKVYAWGEIAVHIYLLLFLASERRIRKMGAQWYDGSEEVVIRMPTSTSPSTSTSTSTTNRDLPGNLAG
ncbi:uncharacterized protein LDX57_007388 [Aspergillus melleus]|uniref:uncharacterized protein n=1 Tax=Aspergillus melleus TaxID=138277 RepID=UPI001E8D407D|nr:uncharacterized protein LDX57_007388 [Aspergillus melleus]KAH8429717.1 hypothetical protein LDX57_007388 [Aspergillus melleus]